MIPIHYHRGNPAALMLALVAFFAFVGLAAAEKITGPALPTDNPQTFEQSCGASGGQLIEITGAFGIVLESSCTFDDGGVNSCDWFRDTCSSEWPRQRDPGLRPIKGSVVGVADDQPVSRVRVIEGSANQSPTDVAAASDQHQALSETTSLNDAAASGGLVPAPATPILVPDGDGGEIITIDPIEHPADTVIEVPEGDGGGIVTTQPVDDPVDAPLEVPAGDGGGVVTTQPVTDPAGEPILVPAGDGGIVTTQPVTSPADSPIAVPEGDSGIVTTQPVMAPASDGQP